MDQKRCYYDAGQYVCSTDYAGTIACWALVGALVAVTLAISFVAGFEAIKFVKKGRRS